MKIFKADRQTIKGMRIAIAINCEVLSSCENQEKRKLFVSDLSHYLQKR